MDPPADLITCMITASGFLKQGYQLQSPATVGDLINAIVAHPMKCRGNVTVDRCQLYTMENVKMPLDYKFATNQHASK